MRQRAASGSAEDQQSVEVMIASSINRFVDRMSEDGGSDNDMDLS